MKKTIALILLFVMSTSPLVACSCKHEWNEATCTLPKTCSVCSETEGAELGHTWIDANCTTAKTCSVCKITDGEKLEHTWQEATCITKKMCTMCRKMEGEALGHSYGEWTIEKEATVLQLGKKSRSCNACDNTESRTFLLDSYVKNNKFIFSPEEFADKFFNHFKARGYSKFGGASTQNNDGQIVVAIRDNLYNNVGNIGFVVDHSSFSVATSETERGFDGIVLLISANDEFVSKAITATVMTCDPSLTLLEGKQVRTQLLSGTVTRNGITYTLNKSGNLYSLTATVFE